MQICGEFMEKITSKSNPLVKETVRLFTSAKFRREQQQFVLEGARLCGDTLCSGVQIERLFATPAFAEKWPELFQNLCANSRHAWLITEEIAAKIADTVTPQGVFAVCSMKPQEFSLNFQQKYIALDRVQDPSNLGAMARTAEALGIAGLLIGGGCDVYNPKALRASMGSLLRLPVQVCRDLAAFLQTCKGKIPIYAAVPESYAKDITTCDFSSGAICVIGNEGGGVCDDVKAVCDRLVTVRMRGKAESLNASTAGAIVMWEMLRGE